MAEYGSDSLPVRVIENGQKRRRGGQPGNINGSRNPWSTFWRRRLAKDEFRWVFPIVEAYRSEIIADKGGWDGITAMEKRMAEIAGTARGCWQLALSEGNLGEARRFLTIERQALTALGLDRRAKAALSLLDGLDHDGRLS